MSEDDKCIMCGSHLIPERIADSWATCEKCASNENWLDSQEIECPSCFQQLIWVIHSPFYDEHFLYCDSCPRHVEVSFYDTKTSLIQNKHKVYEAEGSDLEGFFADLENQLRNCPCGGSFREDAPRRCPYCSTIIPMNEKGRDVFPKDEDFKFDSLVIHEDIWK